MKILFWVIIALTLGYALGDALMAPFRHEAPLHAGLFGVVFAILVFSPLLFLSVRALVRSLREAEIAWHKEMLWQAGIVAGLLLALAAFNELEEPFRAGTCFEPDADGPIRMNGGRFVYADCPAPEVLTDLVAPSIALGAFLAVALYSFLRLRYDRPNATA